MDMSSSTPTANACKISMLWNWYTIDSCFIARTWHVRSKGMFAGTCIGVFFLVVASQWLARFAKEFEYKMNQNNLQPITISDVSPLKGSNSDSDIPSTESPAVSKENPLVYALSHRYLANVPKGDQVINHVIKASLFTVEWGTSYLIMLLFMYYNGYVIISCILGAFFGKLLFGYAEPQGEEVSCCKN